VRAGKLTLPQLADMKSKGERIVMVTAYDAPGARFAEDAGIDILLVGDTAGMVVLGHEGTVPVTMDEMVFLTRAVSRAVHRPLVVGDMPFGSYQVSDEEAVRNAVRFVKESGADVVKLEGAGPSLSRVRAIVAAGIGVMGHVGLTPQSETILGGFKTQGRTAAKARQLLADALALEAAGCFAVVLEAVPSAVAARITEALMVPTIGIGAGPDCDGQVLVYHDLIGLTEGRAPRFVKRYAHVADDIRSALASYATEVRSGAYPDSAHGYEMPDEELEVFSDAVSVGVNSLERSVQTDVQAKPARPGGGVASDASAERVEHADHER
jgi:3-methyl-2-oxobutanoate hydroxymethyltransferase